MRACAPHGLSFSHTDGTESLVVPHRIGISVGTRATLLPTGGPFRTPMGSRAWWFPVGLVSKGGYESRCSPRAALFARRRVREPGGSPSDWYQNMGIRAGAPLKRPFFVRLGVRLFGPRAFPFDFQPQEPANTAWALVTMSWPDGPLWRGYESSRAPHRRQVRLRS